MGLNRAYARRPVKRDLLAGTIEAYHYQFVEPQLKRLNRWVSALVLVCLVQAAVLVRLAFAAFGG